MNSPVCRVVGHKLLQDGSGYLEIKDIKVDSSEQKHARLFAKCERCGESYYVSNVLLPTQKLQPDIQSKFNKIRAILQEVQECIKEAQDIGDRCRLNALVGPGCHNDG